MLITELRKKLRADLESPEPARALGGGWVSGVAALVAAVAGLFFVLCLRYPALLTVPPLREFYQSIWFRLGLHALLMTAFAMAVISLILRVNKMNFDRLGPFLVTPRYHHWHHGIDPQAIDVNFAIHFPLLDRMFGTYHLPPHQWPSAYGIGGHPVPRGYWRQLMYPFRGKAGKG